MGRVHLLPATGKRPAVSYVFDSNVSPTHFPQTPPHILPKHEQQKARDETLSRLVWLKSFNFHGVSKLVWLKTFNFHGVPFCDKSDAAVRCIKMNKLSIGMRFFVPSCQ